MGPVRDVQDMTTCKISVHAGYAILQPGEMSGEYITDCFILLKLPHYFVLEKNSASQLIASYCRLVNYYTDVNIESCLFPQYFKTIQSNLLTDCIQRSISETDYSSKHVAFLYKLYYC